VYLVTSSEKCPRDLARAVEAYGVDAAGIERSVAEELAAKRAARLIKARNTGT